MLRVSIVIPCLNEEETIGKVLVALAQQNYPLEKMEIVLADGGSSDKTLEHIEEFKTEHPSMSIVLINNPSKHIPAALNTAITAATGEVIIRMDAHSLPHRDYVQKCVQALQEGKGENVGGRWEILPGADTWIARGIALAASHPLGAGDAKYRISGKAGPVDTVPFGSFYRSLFDKIGLFDENLLTNEDYELNTRIRQNNGIVWFDPEIVSQYYARPTLKALAEQYSRYGYWKAKMALKYPKTIKLRQALPPLFVAGLFILLVLGLFIQLFYNLFLIVIFIYVGIITFASIPVSVKERDQKLILSFPLAIMTMHLNWGGGFLESLFKKQD
jgi:cellulose synthase/poly-beta-1,6-N-acetylglucosamine synthase-like glycosyltransferase